MIYGTNSHAKFWLEICKEKQDGACAQTETCRTYALKVYEKRQTRMRQQQLKTTGHSNMYDFLPFGACRAICQWRTQCRKCSAVVEIIRSCRRLARNPGWWDFVWTSYTEKWFKKTFRLSKGTFCYILSKIRRDLERHTMAEDPISPECRPAICLYRLERGDYY